MKIKITSKDIVLNATLNDTVAAKDFANRLPLSVTGQDSGVDYCCVLDSGKYKKEEMQRGWKNGDLNLSEGWFAILYGGEEQSDAYENMMIIGRLEEGQAEKIKSLPRKAEFFIKKDVTGE